MRGGWLFSSQRYDFQHRFRMSLCRGKHDKFVFLGLVTRRIEPLLLRIACISQLNVIFVASCALPAGTTDRTGVRFAVIHGRACFGHLITVPAEYCVKCWLPIALMDFSLSGHAPQMQAFSTDLRVLERKTPTSLPYC